MPEAGSEGAVRVKAGQKRAINRYGQILSWHKISIAPMPSMECHRFMLVDNLAHRVLYIKDQLLAQRKL